MHNTMTLGIFIERLEDMKERYGENTPVFVGCMPEDNKNYTIAMIHIEDKADLNSGFIYLDGGESSTFVNKVNG